MDSKILKTIEEVETIKSDWERLETVAPWVSYFSTYRYNMEWLKQYEDDKTVGLFVPVVIHNRDIVGIAPLQIKKKKGCGFSYKELQFIHGGGDYSNFLVHPSVSAEPSKIVNELLNQISAHSDEYDSIGLTHICQFSLLAHQLLISKDNNCLKFLIECPYIDFSKYPSYEAYTKAYIPKKVKQYINRFKREVDFRFEVTDRNVISDLAKIHIAEKDYLQSKGLVQRHSFFENSREVAFREALYTKNANVLTYMIIDNATNDIICYYTGYVWNEIFHSVTTAYNPKYANLAVGKIFNYMIFEENFNHPRWQVFDMGTGRYSWKFEMTDSFNLLYQYDKTCFRNKKQRVLHKLASLVKSVYHSSIDK